MAKHEGLKITTTRTHLQGKQTPMRTWIDKWIIIIEALAAQRNAKH